MRVKDPVSSWDNLEKGKRHRRPSRPAEDDSSDDISGLTCQHVGQAVDVSLVKRSLGQNVWSVCSDCLRERRTNDGEPITPTDIWLCLKCGHQGCSPRSECRHSTKHFQIAQGELHCIVINLSTWIVWCYECDKELSPHYNKKPLAQMADFLQKHASRTESGSSSKVIRLYEGKTEASEVLEGQSRKKNISVAVKGIQNLGNTCFFNAIMQNLAHTHILSEMIQELRENGSKLKIGLAEDSHLDPLLLNLSIPGPLTSAMILFLHSMKDTGKGPLSPKVLFSQLCQKAPKFKVVQQQDSQELLHYLLDAMRIEETKRIQAGILKAFNNPTTKTADEETKRKVKAYGREGVKLNVIDRIFVGELTNTIMCEECGNISMVKEPFIDLSLPIIEQRVSKPVSQGRTSKGKTSQEGHLPQQYCPAATALNTQNTKLSRKRSLTKGKNILNQERGLLLKSSGDEERRLLIKQRQRRVSEGEGEPFLPREINNVCDVTLNGSTSEVSDRGESSHCESSVDADSEDSEDDISHELKNIEQTNFPFATSFTDANQATEGEHTADKSIASCDDGALTSNVSKLYISSALDSGTEPTPSEEALHFKTNSVFSMGRPAISQNPQTAFQTLSHCYITSSKECSVQSCLYQFTSVELLMGSNKLLCEVCTDKKKTYERKDNSASYEKKEGTVYTNARKQMLVSTVPTILILHLKRFHQAGSALRKVKRHVDFPLILDLAPFCAASCKNVSADDRALYSLYGIVEHSGSMRGGHYAAYVKIRMPARRLQEHTAESKNVKGLKDTERTTTGQWVYASDTHVQTVPESRVLNSQAYLLFYERLL